MKRYKRLAMHLIMNKKDPLQLEEFKFTFLEKAGSDMVSVTVSQLRQIIAHIFNDERMSYEERFIQALLGPDAKQGDIEEKLVTFDQI